MFDVRAELRHLRLRDSEVAALPTPDLGAKIDKLGKAQFAANIQLESLEEQTRSALGELRSHLEEAEREVRRQTKRRQDEAERLLLVVDAIDDAVVVARQLGDARWLGIVERLFGRVRQAFSGMGLAEVPAEGMPFDEAQHEVIEQVEGIAGLAPGTVTTVALRGFVLDGRLLRRAQVVTTR